MEPYVLMPPSLNTSEIKPIMIAPIQKPLKQWDEQFMALAIHLGERNLGRTWPNPSVGAVVVSFENKQAPKIISQGITQPGGRPHAEYVALEEAGHKARNATLYVSLEPCSHFGKVPPCVDIIIEAGISRVVAALEDPDLRVAGQGYQRLKNNGIEVLEGVLEQKARKAHQGHIMRVTKKRPFLTAKIAQSRDGYAGSYSQGRVSISSQETMKYVHKMRAKADAIMVGINTALVDDPLLTVRLPGMEAYSPVRIIIDTNLRLPLSSKLVETAKRIPLWVLCGSHISQDRIKVMEQNGVKVFPVPVAENQSVDLFKALEILGEFGLTTIFCEGGPSLLSALAEDDLIDEFIVSEGDIDIGKEGIPALTQKVKKKLEESFELSQQETIDTDLIRFFERRR